MTRPPLSDHAVEVLHRLARAPQPRVSVNPGVLRRLRQEALVEEVDLPSPFTTRVRPDGKCPHLRLTAAGQAVVASRPVCDAPCPYPGRPVCAQYGQLCPVGCPAREGRAQRCVAMTQEHLRQPCASCPWRTTTARGGFPGGRVDVPRLMAMARGEALQSMQCHATPDGARAQVCVGYARAFPDALGLRLAQVLGRYDPTQVDHQEPPLLTVAQLVRKHGTAHPRACRTPCPGCIPACASHPRGAR